MASIFYQLSILDLGFGGDFKVYYFAVKDWLTGGPVYGTDVGTYPLPFLYPPLTLLILLPLAIFPTWGMAYLAVAILQIGAGILLSQLIVRFLRRYDVKLSWVDSVLLSLFCIASILTIGGIRNGNINVFLTLFVTLAAVMAYERREIAASTLFVFSTLFKLFLPPCGIWFVAKKRWRAVVGCVVFGGVAVVLNLLVSVGMTERYVAMVFSYSEGRVPAEGIPVDAIAVSLLRPLSQLLDFGGSALSVIAMMFMLCVVGYLAYETDGLIGDMHLLFWVLLIPTMVAYKEYLEFVIFPLFVLLYIVENTTEYVILAAGSLLIISNFRFEIYSAIVSGPLLELGELLFTVGSVPLYGIAVMLLGAVYHHHSK